LHPVFTYDNSMVSGNDYLSGGVAYARAIDYSSYYSVSYNNVESTGFRITGTYEIGPLVTKKLLHGFSASYILTNATFSEPNFNADIKVRTIPMYYAPKFMIGGEKAMVFTRGAIGMQFARFDIEGDYDNNDHDWGSMVELRLAVWLMSVKKFS